MNELAEIVFVEGIRDEELLKKIFKKCFKYEPKFWPYSTDLDEEVVEIIKSLNTKKTPYLFITDFDPLQFPCVDKRRKSRINEYGAKEENIIVVKSEIESWYASGSYSEDFKKKWI